MNEKYIKQLIRLVEDSDIESLEVSNLWGRRIKIIQRLGTSGNGQQHQAVIHAPAPSAPPPQHAAETAQQANSTAPPAPSESKDTAKLVAIKSPMVGTYYSAPAPDADPYVSINEKITAGQVVCIVEAMKLMNEIESEVSGRIASIEVENAQPVEFGQTLFLVDPQG